MAVLKICHRVVMTPAIFDEWKEHESNFAKRWRRSMVARKKVQIENVPENKGLRNRIERFSASDPDSEAMLKDTMHVEAAMENDRIVISREKEAQLLFAAVSENIEELRDIVWVNPELDGETPLEWLESGAPLEKDRMLGHKP